MNFKKVKDLFVKKICVILGGAKGIGAYFAKKYAAENYAIAFVDIDPAAGRNFAAELTEKYGVKTFFMHADAYSEEDMELFAAAVRAQFHHVNAYFTSFRNCPYVGLLSPLLAKGTTVQSLYGMQIPEQR